MLYLFVQARILSKKPVPIFLQNTLVSSQILKDSKSRSVVDSFESPAPA